MAQDSAFHDGTTVGDATSSDVWKAPYSSAEYSDFYSKLLAGDAAAGYVIPGYGNNLEVTANNPAAMNVLVNTGAAFIRGRLYENTASVTLAIAAADAANPRLDRVVLQYDSTAQTIRLVVLTGTPAATPALPALTQTAAVYEVPLAYVWVAAAAASIAEAEIHDVRSYIKTSNTEIYPNLVRNSEFIGFSTLVSTIAAGSKVPDQWGVSGAGTGTFTRVARLAPMTRGCAIRLTKTSAGTRLLTQTIPIVSGNRYTIKVLISVTAGDVGVIQIAGAASTITKYVRITGSVVEETISFVSNAASLAVSFDGLGNGDIVDVGQVLACQGYHAGPFREITEYIPCFARITDASWDGDAKSTGTTTIDPAADFQTILDPTYVKNIKSIRIIVTAKDSGSAAGNPTVDMCPSNTLPATALGPILRLAGNANDSYQTLTCDIAPLYSTGTASFNINVGATGAATCDVYIDIVGIHT